MSKFDYKGFSKNKLRLLSSETLAYKGLAKWNNFGIEGYSAGRYFREYARFPSLLPLYCYASHGAGPECYPTAQGKYNVAAHELHRKEYAFLTFVDGRRKELQEVLEQPVYTVISPFAWYRRSRNITQSPTAKGTLVFPVHSTSDTSIIGWDIEKYINELKSLPEKYHPICVCCYWREVINGDHKIYMKHGLPVYTAGNYKDLRFIQRWYEITRHFKYTSSNFVGSYTIYSAEMGIPFFLQGEEPKLYQHSFQGAGIEEYYATEKYKQLHEFDALFREKRDSVSDEQKKYAEYYLGIHNTISREKLHDVFWEAFRAKWRWYHLLWLPGVPFRFLRVKTRGLRYKMKGLLEKAKATGK